VVFFRIAIVWTYGNLNGMTATFVSADVMHPCQMAVVPGFKWPKLGSGELNQSIRACLLDSERQNRPAPMERSDANAYSTKAL
jgi:hypothetical protein